MIRILIKRFIDNYDDVNNPRVRADYGVLSGILGILCNLLLFGLKLGIGLAINSVAVLSDAFNNLTDFSSSVIMVIGAKLSSRPPDQEHPYGHGRYDYVGTLIIALIIIWVGLQLARSSVMKIVSPEPVQADLITSILLLFSIGIKVWMYFYNRYIGSKINSSVNYAAAHDSISDAAATGTVMVGITINRFVNWPVDGLLGVAISGMIIYTGFDAARSAVNLLLGTTPGPEITDRIYQIIEASTHVSNVHDLKLHDYGPGRISGSVHVEVPSDAHVEDIHAEIDQIENLIKSELGIDLVIHMDPSSDCDTNSE